MQRRCRRWHLEATSAKGSRAPDGFPLHELPSPGPSPAPSLNRRVQPRRMPGLLSAARSGSARHTLPLLPFATDVQMSLGDARLRSRTFNEHSGNRLLRLAREPPPTSLPQAGRATEAASVKWRCKQVVSCWTNPPAAQPGWPRLLGLQPIFPIVPTSGRGGVAGPCSCKLPAHPRN